MFPSYPPPGGVPAHAPAASCWLWVLYVQLQRLKASWKGDPPTQGHSQKKRGKTSGLSSGDLPHRKYVTLPETSLSH